MSETEFVHAKNKFKWFVHGGTCEDSMLLWILLVGKSSPGSYDHFGRGIFSEKQTASSAFPKVGSGECENSPSLLWEKALVLIAGKASWMLQDTNSTRKFQIWNEIIWRGRICWRVWFSTPNLTETFKSPLDSLDTNTWFQYLIPIPDTWFAAN